MPTTKLETGIDDPFDSLLTIEDTLYTSAYDQGTRDGARAGRMEGRIFGLEKGFEKFAALGGLHGRAVVWRSRTMSSPPSSPPSSSSTTSAIPDTQCQLEPQTQNHLPSVDSRTTRTNRLRNNIQNLVHLTDPLTFSMLNTDDAVADYEDRFKRADAKCKIIGRTIAHISTSVSADAGLDGVTEDIGYDTPFDVDDAVNVESSKPSSPSSIAGIATRTRKIPKKGRVAASHHIVKKSSSTGGKNSNIEDFTLSLNK